MKPLHELQEIQTPEKYGSSTRLPSASTARLRIVVPGGAGDLGRVLARHFHEAGHEVTVFSRTTRTTPWTTIKWNGNYSQDLARAIDGADVVINLAGRTVNCRYTPVHRREIMESRLDTTRATP